MPEPTDSTPVDTPADTTAESPAAVETTEPGDGPPTPSREAAKWRNKFRDAETQITQLAERVTSMQRAEVERIAAETLTDPADMWRAGTQLDDLLTDAGDLDQDKLTGVLDALVAEHRHWRRTGPAAATTTGVGVGKIDTESKTTFTDAFKPRTG